MNLLSLASADAETHACEAREDWVLDYMLTLCASIVLESTAPSEVGKNLLICYSFCCNILDFNTKILSMFSH